MGTALAAGLLSSGWAQRGDIALADPDPAARVRLGDRYPDLEALEAPVPADALVLAVKPKDVVAACRALPRGGYGRALSIVAGVPVARLEACLWPGLPVVRAMPNTPALVGSGASAIAGGSAAGEADLEWAEGLLSALGVVVRLSEPLLDVATGLSGSGPAYIFLVAEALIEAGVLAGLDREVATVLTVQTLVGAGRMLAETAESPERLRAAVTSPGGTTAVGLRALEERGVRAAFLEAVEAAVRRSREIGAEH